MEKFKSYCLGLCLSITLILLIGREIFKVVRKSETSGNYHVAMVTPAVNNTSDDTSESIYNSWETQDCVRLCFAICHSFTPQVLNLMIRNLKRWGKTHDVLIKSRRKKQWG